MIYRRILSTLLGVAALAVVACSGSGSPTLDEPPSQASTPGTTPTLAPTHAPPSEASATPATPSEASATPSPTPRVLTPTPTPQPRSQEKLDPEKSTARELRIVNILPRDAIPAIFDPKFIDSVQADARIADTEPVLGLTIDGDSRAYSLPFLSSSEIVNDVVGGKPVAVTW